MIPTWHAKIITLFPDIFPGSLSASLVGRALENGLWRLDTLNLRDYATDRHRSVDDTPFGGGAGMVLRPDVVDRAIMAAAIDTPDLTKIVLTPRGLPLTQEAVRHLSNGAGVIILCGRFEGIDQRVIDHHKMLEISLGDFVLAGGEVAALAMIEACARLLPGVMGDPNSGREESYEQGLLEYPHYTRPSDWQGLHVPEILLSGHHEQIRAWRQSQSESLTQSRRPDLWQKYHRK
ncbi:MAG: tRNA (guanosine(37)-N1)-methyltransferase TrmD [Alphaproteobacteria bacterium]|nr:tRNA (guanosine(37)-N1)-methyltransferase TrmD [Alphaproteobacteria bacterium]